MDEQFSPMLLDLPGNMFQIWISRQFGHQAFNLKILWILNSGGILNRTRRVHGLAVRTAPAFHPYSEDISVEIPQDKTVSPESDTSAAGTAGWCCPLKFFLFLFKPFQIN